MWILTQNETERSKEILKEILLAIYDNAIYDNAKYYEMPEK